MIAPNDGSVGTLAFASTFVPLTLFGKTPHKAMRRHQTFVNLTAVLLLIQGCSRSPESLLKSAAIKCKQSDYRGAITDYSEAIRLD